VFADRFEVQPHLRQPELHEYAAQTDLDLVAEFQSIRGDVFDDPVVAAVAEKHDASAAQGTRAWLRRAGVAAIPKATSQARAVGMRLDLALADVDVARLDAIADRTRRVQPPFAPGAWERSPDCGRPNRDTKAFIWRP
jgi:2,5-diketo-D-gluconate reductase B